MTPQNGLEASLIGGFSERLEIVIYIMKYGMCIVVLLFACEVCATAADDISVDKPGFEQVVLDIIKRHPEVVAQALNQYHVEQTYNARIMEWRNSRAHPVVFNLNNAPSLGPNDAPLTVVELADFQCYFCAIEQKVIKAFLEEYRGQVRLYFLHFPAPSHPLSTAAAQASWAAWKQGRFFEFEERLFQLNASIESSSLTRIAQELNLDLNRFEAARNSKEAQAVVESDIAQARHAGIVGTPSFVVNGVPIRGAASLSEFEAVTTFLGIPPRPSNERFNSETITK